MTETTRLDDLLRRRRYDTIRTLALAGMVGPDRIDELMHGRLQEIYGVACRVGGDPEFAAWWAKQEGGQCSA